jgi:Ferric reductase like transmembrane component
MDGLVANLSLNPLWNLPGDDPRCVNTSCLAFIIGYDEDQERYSNNNFPFYAKWAVYFYCATILVFTFVYVNRLLTDRGKGTRLKQQFLAYWRMFIYRRLAGKVGEHVDISFGQLAIFSIATIFIAILPFFQGYYLRQLFRYGSPPLSVRCAFLISALLPVCLALAGKVNIISILTGISYAKLNIWHRYVAYVIYCLTIVHLVCNSNGQSISLTAAGPTSPSPHQRRRLRRTI